MVRFKIREILEKHLERTLTDDEILYGGKLGDYQGIS